MAKILLGCTLLVVAFSEVFCNNSSRVGDYDLYVIRSLGSFTIPMVLDAKNSSSITLEEFTGSSTQLWRFKSEDEPGVFTIISNSNDSLVLCAGSIPLHLDNYIEGYRNENWLINFNGFMTNIGRRLNLAVEAGDPEFHSGSNIIVEKEDQQSDYQKFMWMKMN